MTSERINFLLFALKIKKLRLTPGYRMSTPDHISRSFLHTSLIKVLILRAMTEKDLSGHRHHSCTLATSAQQPLASGNRQKDFHLGHFARLELLTV